MIQTDTVPQPGVIILGAGLAGLSAAYALQKQGYRVTILEARPRIGGRVDTRLIPADPNLLIEMGGEWIGASHHHIRALCQEMGLAVVNHHLRMSRLDNGKHFKARQWAFSDRWKKMLRRLAREFRQLSPEEIRELDSIDWWHFLVANHISKKDLEIIDLIGSTDAGEDIRFVSALDALADVVDRHNSYVIKGGNWLLPQKLAEAIGYQDIHLNCKATAVHQTDEGVTVTCHGGEQFHGDYLISTVPASMVPQIGWHPHLPERKQAANRSLDYCRIIKISILFKHRFWRDDYEVATDTLADFIYHATQHQTGEKGVLTAYAVGDRAYVLSNMSDLEKVEAICHALEVPFGNIRSEVAAVYSYYWGDDPYVGGAYALFGKNRPLDLVDMLREPYGRIYFAGEHTADRQGFMEGAVESGQRAAEAIIVRGKTAA